MLSSRYEKSSATWQSFYIYLCRQGSTTLDRVVYYRTIILGKKQLYNIVVYYQKTRLLISNYEKLTAENHRHATTPNTHVDFLIYNHITYAPVLAIEVDVFYYHKDGTCQAECNRLKNEFF